MSTQPIIQKRSKFNGVIWDPSIEEWVAYARDPTGKCIHLGSYKDEKEAARVSSERRYIYQTILFEDDLNIHPNKR